MSALPPKADIRIAPQRTLHGLWRLSSSGNIRDIRRDPPGLIAPDPMLAATASPFQRVLKIDAERWQNPLHNRCEADQSHKDFEQISQAAIAHKTINQIKADCANNDDD
jgi:hypothetical protein